MLFARPQQTSSSSSSSSTPTSSSSSHQHNHNHHLQQQQQQLIQQQQMAAKVTCHGAGLVSGDADLKNSFTVFVKDGNIGGISVAFEGRFNIEEIFCADNFSNLDHITHNKLDSSTTHI